MIWSTIKQIKTTIVVISTIRVKTVNIFTAYKMSLWLSRSMSSRKGYGPRRQKLPRDQQYGEKPKESEPRTRSQTSTPLTTRDVSVDLPGTPSGTPPPPAEARPITPVPRPITPVPPPVNQAGRPLTPITRGEDYHTICNAKAKRQ